MLSRRRKLSRNTFPHHKDPKSSWSGGALRVNAYLSTASEGGGKIPPKEPTPRFAVVIAKRMSDTAVMRNAFKRGVLRAVQGQIKRFGGLPYHKYVILPKEHLRTMTNERIQSDIKMFLTERKQS